jgi:hypothetical protein
MRDLVRLIGWTVVDLFRSWAALEAEIDIYCTDIKLDIIRLSKVFYGLALQLLLLRTSESMDNHDSNVVGAGRVG